MEIKLEETIKQAIDLQKKIFILRLSPFIITV